MTLKGAGKMNSACSRMLEPKDPKSSEWPWKVCTGSAGPLQIDEPLAVSPASASEAVTDADINTGTQRQGQWMRNVCVPWLTWSCCYHSGCCYWDCCGYKKTPLSKTGGCRQVWVQPPLNAKILANSFFLSSLYSVLNYTLKSNSPYRWVLMLARAVRSNRNNIPSSAQPWKFGIYIVPFCVKIHSPSVPFWGKQLFILQASAFGFC